MVRLTCPRCATTFTPPEGITPSCPSCGYSPGGAPAAPAPMAPPPVAPNPYGAPTYPAQQPVAPTYGYPGQPPPQQAYAPGPIMQGPPRTNSMATASLVMGLVGFCTGFTAILAIIFGFIAKNQIKQRGEGGDGMATAGIVLGFIIVAMMVIYLFFIIAFIGAAGI